MLFVQATTGSGGWPMSVWLTPGLQPFYGGTYFPPTSRWGRPGFVEILTELARAWREERDVGWSTRPSPSSSGCAARTVRGREAVGDRRARQGGGGFSPRSIDGGAVRQRAQVCQAS